MVELLIGAALAAGAVSYVLRPIFRPVAPGAAADGGENRAGGAGRRCPSCGHRAEADADAAFCAQCGRGLREGIARCRHCGTPLEAGAQFCSGCGARAEA